MNNPSESSSGLTSGYHDTFWLDTTPILLYESLRSDLMADVVIVGAGIAGLSVAYCAAKSGLKVVVLEDGNIGSGETGRTSAHLSNALDDRYSEIEKTFGPDKARLAAESHTAAIDRIEKIVSEEGIECDFQRVDGYLFLHPSDNIKTLDEELEASRRAGIPTEIQSHAPGIVNAAGPFLKFPRQAQFHPLKYIHGLCKAITKAGGRIYSGTHVSKINPNSVETKEHKVVAGHVVVATNTPVNNVVTMHTKQFAYRTYIIAAKIPRSAVAPSLWWDTGDHQSKWMTQPYHYVRVHPYNEDYDLLICGGEDHKTGQPEKEHISEEERYHHLERWARKYFPSVESVVYNWSGQVMEPLDHLGFIGRNPGNENQYIVTGDSGNGLTNGTIAGMLICDLIMGKANAWEALYDPARITFSVAGNYMKEMGNMAAQYLDYLTPGDIKSVREMEPGEGGVIRFGTRKIAVYKSEDAKIHAFSAVCSHLGCYVHWNADEKSFDCPCHGSRYNAYGKVINGPAAHDLHPVEIAEAELEKK